MFNETHIVPDAMLADLDMQLIKAYVAVSSMVCDNEVDLLRQQSLIVPAGNGYGITYAGVILFGKHPTQFLRGASVRIRRYEGNFTDCGNDFTLVKDIVLDAPLVKTIQTAKDLISAQLRDFLWDTYLC